MLEILLEELPKILVFIPVYEALKFTIKSILPESFKYFFAKKLELFKGSLNSRIPYREVIKQNLATSLDKFGEIRLNFYKEAYSLFFQVLLIDSNISKKKITNEEAEKLYDDLFEKLQKFRENIFINTIYSPEFFNIILNIQMSLHEKLLYKFHKMYEPLLEKENYETTGDASAELDKAGKWLLNKNLTNINLRDIIDFHFEETTEFTSKEKGSIQKRDRHN